MLRRAIGTLSSSLLLGAAAGYATHNLNVAVSTAVGIAVLITVIIDSIIKKG